MKFLVYNDPHNSDRAPISRTEAYTEDILAKMRQIYRIGAERGVNYYINTGDTFHLKAPTKISHWLVQRIYEIFDSASAPTLLAIGGHDLSNGRIESMDKQPLGVLAKSKQVFLLKEGKNDVEGFGFTIVAAPGTPKYENTDSAKDILALGDAEILVAHAPIRRPEDSYPFPTIDAAGLAGHYRLVLYGHMHRDVGAYKVGDTAFVCFGAVARGAYTEEHLSRIPKICIIELTREDTNIKVRVEPIELEVKPSGIAFRMDEIKQQDAIKEEVSQFLSKLQTVQLDVLDKETVVVKIRQMTSIPQVVKDAAVELIENVE